MNEYIKRQNKAREQKESTVEKDIAVNWVNRVTVPKEFNFTPSVMRVVIVDV